MAAVRLKRLRLSVEAISEPPPIVSCTSPLTVWPGAPGSKSFVFTPGRSYPGAIPSEWPCGQCIRCRLSKRRDWSTRVQAHALTCDKPSWFVTWTYDQAHLPEGGTLVPRDLQLALKRVRLDYPPFSHFSCGEYGDDGLRPHYHSILLGVDLDMSEFQPWGQSSSGQPLWRVPSLEKRWGKGLVVVGRAEASSINYVTGYVMKKLNGEAAADAYLRCAVDPLTGAIRQWTVEPVFARMSLNPAIGLPFVRRYWRDLLSGFLVMDGRKVPVPRYFMRQVQEFAKGELVGFEDKRARHMRRQRAAGEFSEARRATKAEVAALRLAKYRRRLDEGAAL